jgi:hypothetical protein
MYLTQQNRNALEKASWGPAVEYPIGLKILDLETGRVLVNRGNGAMAEAAFQAGLQVPNNSKKAVA